MRRVLGASEATYIDFLASDFDTERVTDLFEGAGHAYALDMARLVFSGIEVSSFDVEINVTDIANLGGYDTQIDRPNLPDSAGNAANARLEFTI